jgi:hypothetical protein
MTDPRYTDPRNQDPLIVSNTSIRSESAGGIWGWLAGLAVLALIAFAVVAGWNSGPTDTAANNPATSSAPATPGSGAPMRNVTPPSTTGSGASSPMTDPARPSAPPAGNGSPKQ